MIACLKVAQEMMKFRAEYFKSEEARIGFEISKKNNDKLTKKGYEKEWLKIYLDGKIQRVIEKMGETNGATVPELHSKLIKGTTALVKELGVGTEFHLSLNPPEYAKEEAGRLVIDYKKIQEIRAGEKKELEDKNPKQIPESIESE